MAENFQLSVLKELCLSAESRCVLMKWKVAANQKVSKGSILAVYKQICGETQSESGIVVLPKLKCECGGVVKRLLVTEGEEVSVGQPVIAIEVCRHKTIMKDMCADCGMDLRCVPGIPGNLKEPVSASVALVHNIPELRVSKEEAEVLGKNDKDTLLKNKKLVLLVDLDQTLIHTTNEYVLPDMKDVYHFQLYGQNIWYHTKFRPGWKSFLEDMSKYYELHIFTMGSRMYAHTIARMLDPNGELFADRIRSRDESFDMYSKYRDLRILFPCDDSMVCIIDDREDIWDCAPNLVTVKPYRFFHGTGDINAPLGSDETFTHPSAIPVHDDPTINLETTANPSAVAGDGKTGAQNAGAVQENISKEKLDTKEAEEDKVKQVASEIDAKPEKNSANLDTETDSPLDGKEGAETTQEVVPIVSKKMLSPDEVVHARSENNCLHETKFSPIEKKSQIDSIQKVCLRKETSGTEEHVALENGDDVAEKQGDIFDERKKSEDNDLKEKMEASSSETGASETAINGDAQTFRKKEGGSLQIAKEQGTTTHQVDNSEKCEDDCNVGKEKSEAKENLYNSANNNEVTETERHGGDADDYLLYLEDILRRIHTRFYEIVDNASCQPDLRNIMPELRQTVLQGKNIVFTGVIPTNCKHEDSQVWRVASQFGANVTKDLMTRKNTTDRSKRTSHVVAARPGTEKACQALRLPNVKLVNPNWLWTCAERWELVDERLFPVEEYESYKARRRETPPVKGSDSGKSGRDVYECRGEDPIEEFPEAANPFLSFSSGEMEEMDKEVEDLMRSSGDEGNEVLGSISSSSSESDDEPTGKTVKFSTITQTLEMPIAKRNKTGTESSAKRLKTDKQVAFDISDSEETSVESDSSDEEGDNEMAAMLEAAIYS